MKDRSTNSNNKIRLYTKEHLEYLTSGRFEVRQEDEHLGVFDKESGKFLTKIRKADKSTPFGKDALQYRLWVQGKGEYIWLAHRLIWTIHFKRFPEHDLVMLDGDLSNIVWSNMKEKTPDRTDVEYAKHLLKLLKEAGISDEHLPEKLVRKANALEWCESK